jgi:hypothetical protein
MKEILINSEFFVSLFAVFLRALTKAMARYVISLSLFESATVALLFARM